MEGNAKIMFAKQIFGQNYIGKKELTSFLYELNFEPEEIDSISIPNIQFSKKILLKHSKDYILILGIKNLKNVNISIRFMRTMLGISSDNNKPSFYNQDWYVNERFIDLSLDTKWYLVKKTVFDELRAHNPNELIFNNIKLPSALLCTYTFFAVYFNSGEILWPNDYVWCCDTDHNGDQIYVGRYEDANKINKNGFSIHRYLTLNQSYSSINIL